MVDVSFFLGKRHAVLRLIPNGCERNIYRKRQWHPLCASNLHTHANVMIICHIWIEYTVLLVDLSKRNIQHVYVLYPPVAPPIQNNDCTIFLLSVYISENHSITSADKYRNIAKYDIIGLF